MIEVLKPGLYTSIQDLGRFQYRSFGVPVSGAMDAYSATKANLLLNNNSDCSVLECTQLGPELQFSQATQIAICGADISPCINNKAISVNKVYTINTNDVLSFGKLKYGIRAYIGIKHGFKTELVLNSRSYYQPITLNKVIYKSLQIPYALQNIIGSQSYTSVAIDYAHYTTNELSVYKGPEFHLLDKAHTAHLLQKNLTISINNRMAYQLAEAFPNNLPSILTSAVLPGCVQLTPSGKLIILMRDAQTTGGYSRILQLTDQSINILSQKKTGDTVNFKFLRK